MSPLGWLADPDDTTFGTDLSNFYCCQKSRGSIVSREMHGCAFLSLQQQRCKVMIVDGLTLHVCVSVPAMGLAFRRTRFVLDPGGLCTTPRERTLVLRSR